MMIDNAQIYKSATADVHGLRLSLMGSEGCGKTCFFAGLAWLGSAARQGEFGVIGRNEASQAFVNDLRDTLARNELPQSTHKTDDLALDILYRGARIGIDIENFAGEEFRAVGSELRENSSLFSKFVDSRYLVLFLDIENDVDHVSQTNVERLDAVLNLLSTETLCDGSRKLAVVLTKADLRGITKEEASSSAAREYLQTKQPGLFEKIGKLGYATEFFFLAPIGRSSLADGQTPAPFGYAALFNWLLGDLRDEKVRTWIHGHKILLSIVGAALVFALGDGSFRFVRKWHANHVLAVGANPTQAEVENALRYADQPHKDDFVDREIDDIRKTLLSVDTLSDLDALQDRVAQWEGMASEDVEKRLSELERELQEKREDLHRERIIALKNQGDIAKCRSAIGDYLSDRKAARLHKAEIEGIRTHLDGVERDRKRAEIRKANVVSGRLDTLQRRCDLVAEYPFPDETSKKEATRAVAIGRLFLADLPYHIEIKSAKGLPSAHRTRMELSNLGPSNLQQVETTHLKSRNPQWNKNFELRWKPGDRIRVAWLWKSPVGLFPTAIGTQEFNDPWTSLLDILGGVDLRPETGVGHARLGGNIPQVTIVCDEFKNPADDLRVFKRYIVPGTYWQ